MDTVSSMAPALISEVIPVHLLIDVTYTGLSGAYPHRTSDGFAVLLKGGTISKHSEFPRGQASHPVEETGEVME